MREQEGFIFKFFSDARGGDCKKVGWGVGEALAY